MSPFVVALVLCSAFMHACWNLLGRWQRDETVFFRRMLIVIVSIGFAPAILSETLTHSLTLKAWACVAGSGFFCALYLFSLARAYGSSDFTIVYPVARALPVFFVGIGDVLRGRYPTAIGWIGMSLVISGCFLVPLRSFGGFTVHSYLNRTTLWLLLTAVGTVGYTLLDKVASEVVKRGPATAARYGYMFFLISFIAYTMFLEISRPRRKFSNSVGWKIPIFAACLMFGAYWLVLWAYQLCQHASYILAFRQFSIIIAVILAFAIYKELGLVVRLAGAFMITSGLVLIGLWGS